VKTIQIDQDIYSYVVSMAVDLGDPISRILRREPHLAPPPNSVDDVYAYLVSQQVNLGESASSILRRKLHLAGGGPDRRVPHPGGTGGNPWNTPAGVLVAVGDTLRIVNDDA
jgi:negative regulator of replication initiation